MATSTTISGLPVPEGSDANNVPSDMSDLADAIDGTIVKKLTSAQIAALDAGERPAGTYFHNSTTSKLQVSNGSAVVDVAAPVYAIGVRTSSLSVATSGTTVTYESETDPGNLLNASTGKFTAPGTGVYQVCFQGRYVHTTSSGSATVHLVTTDGTLYPAHEVLVSGTNYYGLTIASLVALTAGQDVWAMVSAGGASNAVTNCRFTVHRVGL